ncbi:MAG: hypothetical protein AAF485_13335 [Chloroflexota bacterium]
MQNNHPKIYTLDKVSVVGHLRDTYPDCTTCSQCNREIKSYESLKLVLDTLPECDFVAASGGSFFISHRLLMKFQEMELTGYVSLPIEIETSDDFGRSVPEFNLEEIPKFYYFRITGKCDGPWISHRKKGTCSSCGQETSEINDFNAWLAELKGDLPKKNRLVFFQTWQKEDFFEVTEPGPPFITEKVVAILDEVGNLKTEVVQSQTEIKAKLPQYAEQLEKNEWEINKCIKLRPAEWIIS